MSHINVYRPRAARAVNCDKRQVAFVEVTEDNGSTVNLWVPYGTEQAVADAINGSLRDGEGGAA